MPPKRRTEPLRGPVYEPGRQTAEAVFDAAESLFAQHGFERSTIRMVAAAAGVTVGSVYQFFDDKQALLDRIGTECLAVVDDVFSTAGSMLESQAPPVGRSVGTPGPVVTITVAAIVNGLVGAAAQRPMFRTLLVGSATDGPLQSASESLRARVEQHIEALLKRARHHRSPTRVRRTALVCSHTIRGLIGTVIAPDGRVDASMLAELETVLTLYVFHTKAPN